MRRVLPLLLLPLAGCVYYNGMYNANRFAERARKAEAQGRTFELPAIATQETVGVVRYLMSIPSPSPEVIAAVEGAVQWLRQVELTGWRLQTFDAPAEQFRQLFLGQPELLA